MAAGRCWSGQSKAGKLTVGRQKMSVLAGKAVGSAVCFRKALGLNLVHTLKTADAFGHEAALLAGIHEPLSPEDTAFAPPPTRSPKGGARKRERSQGGGCPQSGGSSLSVHGSAEGAQKQGVGAKRPCEEILGGGERGKGEGEGEGEGE